MQPHILIACAQPESPRYREAVALAGGIPHEVYCPAAEEALRYDGLLITGGGDVHPDLYAQGHLGVSLALDKARDEAEIALIDAFTRARRPVLAVCRGAQLLNVARGGTLVQDLPEPARSLHRSARGSAWHTVRTAPSCFLWDLYGASALVNSIHHQAVRCVGKGLTPCQWSEDGIVEGFYDCDAPVWGVQWHPERMCNPAYCPEDAASGLPLFRWWIEQART